MSNPVQQPYYQFSATNRPIAQPSDEGDTGARAMTPAMSQSTSLPIHHRASVGAGMAPFMPAGESSGSGVLSKREILSLLRQDYLTNAGEEALGKMYEYLNFYHQSVNASQLTTLTNDGFREFFVTHLEALGTKQRGAIHNLLPGIRAAGEVYELFTKGMLVRVKADIAISHYKRSGDCVKTAANYVAYRVGAYQDNQANRAISGERERCRQDKFGRRVFEQDTINHQGTAHGFGFYTSSDIHESLRYATMDYNQKAPMTMLEVHAKEGLVVLDLRPDSAFYKLLSTPEYIKHREDIIKALRRDEFYAHNTIHIADVVYQDGSRLKTGYTIFKNPDSVEKVVPFHPSMSTKLHIPFTREEIENKQFCKKVIKGEEIPLKARYIGLRKVSDPYQEQVMLEVYRFPVKIHPELAKMRGLSSPYEYKFYAVDDAGDKIRVKPDALLYRKEQASIPEYDTFHVQYHKPAEAAKTSRFPQQVPSITDRFVTVAGNWFHSLRWS